MAVVVNDFYAFDGTVVIELEEFEDVITRAFRQPEAGLGFGNSPVAHMWRSIIWPNNFSDVLQLARVLARLDGGQFRESTTLNSTRA